MAESRDEETSVGLIKSVASTSLSTAFAPARLAISRPARKFYLTSFFFFIASIVLLTISSVAYSVFYFNYIPQISLDKVIHLQFGDDAYPYGVTTLSEPQLLIKNQAYDVSVSLNLPRTPTNLAAGNFMLDLRLLSSTPNGPASSTTQQITSLLSLKDNAILSHSRRPAILSQPTHSFLSMIDTLLWRLPWSLITYPLQPSRSTSILTLESDDLEISMFESLSFKAARSGVLPSIAQLEIQTLKHAQALQIYGAELHFRARFTGLKYLVYNYRVLSFLVFTGAFYTTSVATMAFAWGLFTVIFWFRGSVQRDQERSARIKLEKSDLSSNGHVIKPELQEEEDDSLLSMSNVSEVGAPVSPAAGGSRQMPLRFPLPRSNGAGVTSPTPGRRGRPSQVKREPSDESIARTTGLEPLRASPSAGPVSPEEDAQLTDLYNRYPSVDWSVLGPQQRNNPERWIAALEAVRDAGYDDVDEPSDTMHFDDRDEDIAADPEKERGFDSGLGTSIAGGDETTTTSAREWGEQSSRSRVRSGGSRDPSGEGLERRRSRNFEH